VLVVAGPAQQWRDGFIAARVLAERGYQVRVMLLGEAGALRGDAAEAARLWRRSIEPAAPDAIAGAASSSTRCSERVSTAWSRDAREN